MGIGFELSFFKASRPLPPPSSIRFLEACTPFQDESAEGLAIFGGVSVWPQDQEMMRGGFSMRLIASCKVTG